MKRQNAEPVGDIIHQFLRAEGLETPYNEYRLIASWGEIMGEGIARKTSDLQIRDRILYAHIASSILRSELMLNRAALVHKLNTHIGAQVIDNVQFY